MPLVLASASPRRAELLRAAGIPFDVVPADVDESVLPGEAPDAHVRRLARAKARAASARVPGRVVVGADTVVVVDGVIFGKPSDDADAARMLTALAGRPHRVLTGVAVERDGVVRDAVEETAVTFGPMSEAEIRAYVRSGEPRGKAGAYAIQGLASRFVDRVEGSYPSVMGLPVATVCRLLREVAPELVDSSH